MRWILPCLALIGLSCNREEPNSLHETATGETVQVKTTEIISREGVVNIEILTAQGHSGVGSGAYIQIKGRTFVITAAHVVEDALITLVSSRTTSTPARVLVIDKAKDIAFLEVAEIKDVKPIKFKLAPSDSLSLGDELYYTGFPNGFGPLTIRGNIAAFGGTEVAIMQSYAWPGASGSLVLDKKGRAVGVLVAIELLTGRNGELINNANIVYVNLIDKNFMDVLDDLLDK
jgi:S1-C subfamily serine protease